eukprot:3347239-Karenia_brevis.AAC.1
MNALPYFDGCEDASKHIIGALLYPLCAKLGLQLRPEVTIKGAFKRPDFEVRDYRRECRAVLEAKSCRPHQTRLYRPIDGSFQIGGYMAEHWQSICRSRGGHVGNAKFIGILTDGRLWSLLEVHSGGMTVTRTLA